MAVKVRIPTPLLSLTGGKKEVTAEGATLKELVEDLERRYPGLKERLCDEDGNLRRFINFFVNDEDIRFLQGEETPLKEGDVVSIVPAIAGG
jgi:molybdopterin synthase sulfur carrier subunit